MFNLLTKAVRAMTQMVEHAHAIRQLRAMSDRELRDIGIARAEIEAVVTGKVARASTDPALVRPTAAANRRHAPMAQATFDAA